MLPAGIINTADPFSVFMWVRLDNKLGTSNQMIFRQDRPEGHGRNLLFRDPASEKLCTFLGAVRTYSTQAVFQNTGEWHHVGLTYNNHALKLYIDGEEDGSNNVTAGAYTSGFRIGRVKNPSSTYGSWDGVIDEIVMYDKALSPEEVEQLYQAGAGGPPELVDLEIEGPDEVPDSNSAAYNAIAYYDDSSSSDVTTEAIWSVEPDTFADIDANGVLTTQQLNTLEETIWISAEYTEGPNSITAIKEVVIFANCTIEALIRRNISGAVQIKENILGQLETALDKEKAAEEMLRDMQQSRDTGQWSFLQVVKARVRVVWAIVKETWVKHRLEAGKDNLEDSLEILGTDNSQPAPLNNGRGRRTGLQKRGR
jgi:hypothetical protein